MGALRELVASVLGRRFLAKVDDHCPTQRLGSDYGGWSICPDGIGPESVVYSAGVGEDVSFDLELIGRYGVTVHAFDPTPRSLAWVRGQSLPERFIMHEVGLAAFDGDATFHPPQDPTHASYTLLDRSDAGRDSARAPVRRLTTLMDELGHDRIDILKMDIEGAEIDVIADMLAGGIYPHQVLVEFHHHLPEQSLVESNRAVRRLRRAGYNIFAISPSGREVCFIYRGRR